MIVKPANDCQTSELMQQGAQRGKARHSYKRLGRGAGAAKRRLLPPPRRPGAIAALPQGALFGALQPPRLLGGK
jgi:hypothetical protein